MAAARAVGITGRRRPASDLRGEAVNTASRMELHGTPGVIQVSAATFELLRDRYSLTGPVPIVLKGIGERPVYRLVARHALPADIAG